MQKMLGLKREVGFEAEHQHGPVQHRTTSNHLNVLKKKLVRVADLPSDERFDAKHLRAHIHAHANNKSFNTCLVFNKTRRASKNGQSEAVALWSAF